MRRRPRRRATFTPQEALQRLSLGGDGPLRLIYSDPPEPQTQQPGALGSKKLVDLPRWPPAKERLRLLRLGWQAEDPTRLEFLQVRHCDLEVPRAGTARVEVMARIREVPNQPGLPTSQLCAEWHLQPRAPLSAGLTSQVTSWLPRKISDNVLPWNAKRPMAGNAWTFGKILWADRNLLVLQQGQVDHRPVHLVYARDRRAQQALRDYFSRRYRTLCEQDL